MLIQALAAYADEYLPDQLSAEAWEEKPVPILIDIAADGTFLGAIDRRYQATRGKKKFTLAQPLLVPKSPVNRNNGEHPLLAADDIKYVLGSGPWTVAKDAPKADKLHQAFIELIQKAAAGTHDAATEACALFYQREDQVKAAREALKDSKPAVFVALSVDGPLVMRPAVKSFWNEHYRRAFQERVEAGGVGECIISGRTGPIAPTHAKIKGTANVGGRAEVSLMSFDKSAFRSYGWEKNANSPIDPERAMAYVLALNDLLRGEKHRRNVAGTAFLYWTRKRTDFDPMAIIEQPTIEQVSALLQLDPGATKLDPEMFYMAGLAGNGARLVVRYWLAESLGRIKANLKGWFEGLRMVKSDGQLSPPPRLWILGYAIHRKGEPNGRQALALIRRAIEGAAQPLGYDILSALLARLRHPPESKPQGTGIQIERFAAARLGLLRLCLNDICKGEKQMTETLDPGQDHPAYLCGRLLAEYEDLQEVAYRSAGESKINLTVADRYYSLASSNPKVAFPKIEGLGKSHFRKLRRENRGAMIAIERRVAELHERIGTQFPPALGPDGQGRFALGYYHQKAEKNRQIAEYKAAKAANNEATERQEEPQ